jgi:hypothetical protein
MGLVLNLMAETGRKLSELADELPAYTIVKDKYHIERERLPCLFAELPGKWPEAVPNRLDGLRLDLQNGERVHVFGNSWGGMLAMEQLLSRLGIPWERRLAVYEPIGVVRGAGAGQARAERHHERRGRRGGSHLCRPVGGH